MGTEIKSNFDDIRRQAKQTRRRSRWNMLWSVPFFLVCKLFSFVVRYPYVFLVAAIIVVAAFFVHRVGTTSDVKITHTEHIGKTVNHVTQIKAIGQWEALNISCEEMVDSVEEHILGDKHLIKIFHGRIILGIDLKDAPPKWLVVNGDTAFICLPKVKVLNPDFIDEARTRTFYEKGTWNEEANEALYQKARKAMLRRNLTAAQKTLAAENIRRQFESMFVSFGYKEVVFLPEPYKKNP